MKPSFSKFLAAFSLVIPLYFLQVFPAQAKLTSDNASVRTTSRGYASNSLVNKTYSTNFRNSNIPAAHRLNNSVDAPTLSINNASVNEGNSGTTALTFTVSLSDASSESVTVNYSTTNSTASDSSDFQAVSGALFFAPGEITKTIVVLINGDLQAEADETFTVNLSDAVNASIVIGTGIGSILNDDGGNNVNNCTYSISPTVLNTNSNGSSANTIFVTTQPGCSYTATTNNSFITINSGSINSGSGTVSFSVDANTGTPRVGTILVAGQIFTVNQAGFGSSGLRVSIIDSPDPVTLDGGRDINYSIFVTNDGPSPATGVVLTDTLPAGVNFVSVSTIDGSCAYANGVVTCNLNNVNSLASVTITVRPTMTGTFTNTVSIRGNEQDPNPGDNIASTTTTVVPQPGDVSTDLRIVAFSSPGSTATLENGLVVIYTIFVDNDGPSPATGVVLSSALSPNLTFVSASTPGGTCGFSSGVVTCNIGNLSVGTSVFITARPTAPGTVSNTISVRGNEPDPITSNNSATLTTRINPPAGTVNADLRVIAFDPQNTVRFNNFEYQIYVNNDGPSPATNVVLTDTLPSGVSFVSATPSQGSCAQANGIVTCSLGTVTGNVFVSVIVRPMNAETITNTVNVKASEPDFNSSNNTATTVITVNPLPKSRKRVRVI